MTFGIGLMLAVAAAPTPMVGVSLEADATGRHAVVLHLRDAELPLRSQREGTRVVVELPREAAAGLALPPPRSPVVGMTVEHPTGGGPRLVVQLARPMPYEERREGNEVRLAFSEPLPADDVEVLAQRLFPPAGAAPAPRAMAAGEAAPMRSEPRVRVRPMLSAAYARGDNNFETSPQPEDDSYYDLAPKVEVFSGPLRLGYVAHVRGDSRYEDANIVTHDFDAGFEHQLASEIHLGTTYAYQRGRHHPMDVDPGGEYFYGYRSFRRHQAGADARVPMGGATALILGGGWNQVRFDEAGTFLDFTGWNLRGGLRRELAGQTSVDLQYHLDEVYDASDADVAGTTSQTVAATLTSEVRPLLHLHASLGLRRSESPGAPAEARTLTDLVVTANLRRQFSESTAVGLGYTRARYLSAFERNPSYRSDAFELNANAPLPWLFSMAGSLGYRRNAYPLPAEGLPVARHDDIWGWSVGVGRPVGSRAVARVEYQRLWRDSNLASLSSRAHAFLVQVDITPLRKGSGQ